MDKENKHPYKDRKYDVVPYDPNWAAQFEAYASTIRAIFGSDVRIEHIGSTSVPGMSGKAYIDVLVIVNDLKVIEEHAAQMEKAGFEDAGQFVMEDSHLFRVMKDNALLANIHFFLSGHPRIAEMLAMRDYLRANPKEVEAYSNLKKGLYSKYPNDYASYRKDKDEYMEKLKERIASSKKI